MKTITIVRSRWLRNNGMSAQSVLLDEQGRKCCLGFAICQISKLPKERLLDKMCPRDVFAKESFLTDEDLWDNELATDAMAINDYYGITEAEREKKLTNLFRKHGFKLRFVD